MSKWGRGVLVALFAVVLAAIVQDFRFDLSSIEQHAAAAATDRMIGSMDRAVANLRAAQAGYVAAGQGPESWMTRSADLSSEIEARLSDLLTSTRSAEARPHYEAAQAAFTSLREMDKKARAAVAGGERLQASDLIFIDSMDPAQRLASEIEAARDAEAAHATAQLTLVRRSRLAVNGAALLLVLSAAALSLRAKADPKIPDSAPAPPAPVELPRIELPPIRETRPEPSVNLGDAAEVCVDLARVLDGRDVPPLLERAAGVLDAKGVILWVMDESGAVLRPSLAYGYSDKVLVRLGSLETAADNPTSFAFRSMQAQIIPSPAAGSTGAIAVPLITSSGCVGVLAAEINSSTPGDDTLSVARMIAAQLATLVAPAASDAPQQVAQA
jgi:hypothetical protein